MAGLNLPGVSYLELKTHMRRRKLEVTVLKALVYRMNGLDLPTRGSSVSSLETNEALMNFKGYIRGAP